MKIDEWHLYNHGWLPQCAPHETPDLSSFKASELFRRGGVLVRYTTDFDHCETQDWWYVVKDDAYDISKLKAKHRWVVKQGEKNFEVKRIDPISYREDIFLVAIAAFSAYPAKYRPDLQKEQFFREIDTWKDSTVYGAFYRETGKLAGYSVTKDMGSYIAFPIQKTDPEYEKYQVNAALVYCILSELGPALTQGKYICDGERNILHETGFPDYLIKYFGFRKAYCKLHLIIAPKIRWIVCVAYPFRKVLYKLDGVKKLHQLNGILRMREILRAQK